ncbi:MipA/OmpV family protein [Candidatus Sodalis endolongispinus]|uniref:MipA/OmpV family protein n=1 Tax=Candidatus Sodalis endolongispinus TaxID=2812662 RepID=A0ABS5YCW8_9GAMM|nr:MipA/OmpV family protein [Candidatus Sodalis endolongispinus]MBT9432865.1 MipA/OmpV family protein [Candidatus Sodalis endolongispinus]
MLLSRADPRRWMAVILLTGTGVLPAHAADANGSPAAAEDESHWGLGLGNSLKRSPYRGVGTDAGVLPLLSYENRYLRYFGTTLDAKLPSAGPVDFAVRAQYRLGEGYKASDADYLDGMAERKGGLALGLATTWHNPFAEVSLEWLRATDNSKGNRVTVAVERTFDYDSDLHFTPYIEVQRADLKDVDYYFGVRDSESRPDRATYDGKASTNINGGLRMAYALTRHQHLLLDVGIRYWGSGVTDSPLVDHDASPSLRLGYLYRFE